MIRSFTYTFGGLLIGLIMGAIVGIMAGLGESNYYNKSQREFAAPALSIIGGLVLGIAGAGIGYRLGNNLRKEEVLGIDKAVITYDKQGRFWIAQTVWQGNDGIEHKIITKKAQSGELSSTYNDDTFFNHGINSGSLENVKKAHNNVMQQVYSSLKSKI